MTKRLLAGLAVHNMGSGPPTGPIREGGVQHDDTARQTPARRAALGKGLCFCHGGNRLFGGGTGLARRHPLDHVLCRGRLLLPAGLAGTLPQPDTSLCCSAGGGGHHCAGTGRGGSFALWRFGCAYGTTAPSGATLPALSVRAIRFCGIFYACGCCSACEKYAQHRTPYRCLPQNIKRPL